MSQLRGSAADQSASSELVELANLYEAGSAGRRDLDARIALAIFPGLADLKQIGIAVWQHPDGSRIRALRYSDKRSAATTLLPAGCWIEKDPGDRGRVSVHGPSPQDVVSAQQFSEPLAIAAACLRMQARIKTAQSAVPDRFKETVMVGSIISPALQQ